MTQGRLHSCGTAPGSHRTSLKHRGTPARGGSTSTLAHRPTPPDGASGRRPHRVSPVSGSLMVLGTTSDAGKTVVTTGLCRALVRRGLRVAPFKAQNMSNNSMVTADGAEIGRAQWVQALAARAEPEAAMNPVLLKPGSDL